MTMTVIVPTFRRPEHLGRCLAALAAQQRPVDQIVVVCRPEDEETAVALRQTPVGSVQIAHVDVRGVVAAMSVGLAAANCEIVALIDDDAAPHTDWSARLEPYWADPTIGGVGGRDVVYVDGRPVDDTARTEVGRIRWYGKVIGNHHVGVGPPRDVDLLKGVNCAYRRSVLQAIGFERRLRGAGAQVHWELALGLAVRAWGYRMVYDPAILVDHHVARRFDGDTNGRGKFHADSSSDIAFNETVVVLTAPIPRWRRVAYLGWAFAIGTRSVPGLLHALLAVATRKTDTAARVHATWSGRSQGIAAAVGLRRRNIPASSKRGVD